MSVIGNVNEELTHTMHEPAPEAFEKIARDVLDNLLEGCQVVGFDWKYLYINDAVVRQGRRTREELLGRTMMECYPGIESTTMFSGLRRCMTERVHDRMENEFSYPDGSTGWFELRFIPVPAGSCILSIDITDRKRAETALARSEEQLRQAQKMEAVGRLAGGIAHDFNNVLAVILSYSALVLRNIPDADPIREDLLEIRTAGERAASLTRQLLAFSRRQVLEPRIVNLNEIVANTEKMLRRIIGEDIGFVTRASADLANCRVDPGQMEQVLLNLVVNARDAMPTGGKLTIETANVDLDEAYARTHVEVPPGRYVMLAVSDTGIGMDRATQARIFEPFFSTKEKGKGTGLGLAMVHGIIKQSGGHVWIYSEPSLGATFKVYLPRIDGATEPLADRKSDAAENLRGSETVLLVEDDDPVRSVAARMLRGFGYNVLEARNAGEALLVCESHPARIHVLLTDVVMPHMSGPQLAARLAATRPGVKVLCMSGYSDEAVLHHGVLDSGVQFLQKPFTPDALARRLREVLDASER